MTTGTRKKFPNLCASRSTLPPRAPFVSVPSEISGVVCDSEHGGHCVTPLHGNTNTRHVKIRGNCFGNISAFAMSHGRRRSPQEMNIVVFLSTMWRAETAEPIAFPPGRPTWTPDLDAGRTAYIPKVFMRLEF